MPKKISVIIVSHNALIYLDLCLKSVQNAFKSIDHEIILVDNASSEPVSNWVRENFPEVHLISSNENLGFGKANNLGLEKASGEIILYLNPDTVISKDTVEKVISKIDSDSSIGAVGVRMINGRGEFLPESKRSVPGVWSSLSRVLGLSSVFPKSKLFSAYRLGHINEYDLAEVEVLSGACMFVRVQQEELKKFDTDFFMYGEDIDLSYRILKSGYRVLYIGNTTIVHFKGESTNKKNWSFHYWFYKTMWIFRKKHSKGVFASLSNIFIYPFVWLLMLLAYTKSQFSFAEKKMSGFEKYFVIGRLSKKLKLSLEKFSKNSSESNLEDADLLVVHVQETPPEMIIENLDSKIKDQKLIFWNERLERFFGSY